MFLGILERILVQTLFPPLQIKTEKSGTAVRNHATAQQGCNIMVAYEDLTFVDNKLSAKNKRVK